MQSGGCKVADASAESSRGYFLCFPPIPQLFMAYPFLDSLRSLDRDLTATLAAGDESLTQFAVEFCSACNQYLDSCVYGPYARARALQGLCKVSSAVRTRLHRRSCWDTLLAALFMLNLFRKEGQRSVDHGFVAGPTPTHAATCLWVTHRYYLWTAECLALVCAVHAVDPTGWHAEETLGALVHPDDWAKVVQHLHHRVPDSEFIAAAVRAVIFLRASLPGVSGACEWVSECWRHLGTGSAVFQQAFPQPLRSYLTEGLLQVAHFWTCCGSRVRHRNAMALMDLVGPQDVDQSQFMHWWFSFLCKAMALHVLVPCTVPFLWRPHVTDSMGSRHFLAADFTVFAEDVGKAYVRSGEVKVVHDLFCSRGSAKGCNCGATVAAAVAASMRKSAGCPLQLEDTRLQVLMQVSVDTLEFVGPLGCMRTESCFRRVLHCGGDSALRSRGEGYGIGFSIDDGRHPVSSPTPSCQCK